MSESTHPIRGLSILERWSEALLTLTNRDSIFKKEQRRRLLQELGREGKTADRFLKAIEPHLRDFATWEQAFRESAMPSRTIARKQLQILQRRVAAVHESLSGLGSGDEYWWLVDRLADATPRPDLTEGPPPEDGEAEYRAYEAAAMGRDALAEEFLADLTRRIAHLRSLVDSGLPRYQGPRRGRPQNFTERRLIEGVAKEYAACFGRLPSSAKEGTFHAFVVLLLEYAECPQADCSRVLKKAIDGLKRGDEGSD